jgi:hypothetical protein
MNMLSSVFWFLSLPVFIYVSYQLSKLAVLTFEKNFTEKAQEVRPDEQPAE